MSFNRSIGKKEGNQGPISAACLCVPSTNYFSPTHIMNCFFSFSQAAAVANTCMYINTHTVWDRRVRFDLGSVYVNPVDDDDDRSITVEWNGCI